MNTADATETKMKRRKLNLAALSVVLAPTATLVRAQKNAPPVPWPVKTVRILVGFPAGSTPDTLARTVAEPLSKALGQPVVVENKAGANGQIATEQIAKATDNHTIGIVGNGLLSGKLLGIRLPYEPASDFSYISLLATAPLLLVASMQAPDAPTFFAAAVQHGDEWNYGSVGNGSMGHLAMEVLKTRVRDLMPTHVPFKGNPDVITSLISGEIQMALVPPGIAMTHVKAGRLKVIGVAGGRSAVVPEVPSLAEIGVRDFNVEVWAALVGPAGLARTAQDRLASVVPSIMRSPATRQSLLVQGWQAVGTAPDGLRHRIKDEAAVVDALASTRGIHLK